MSGPKWMREAAARERAEALGIPVLRCPECNELGKHWVPDSLERPGYFTCAPVPSGPRLSVVGLDLSLTATGIATITSDQVSARTVRSRGKAGDGLLTRAVRLHNLTEEVIGWASLGNVVVIEQPAYGQTGGSHHDRSGLWWLVMDALTADVTDERFAEVTPQGVKMYATGKGNASKSEVLAAVLKRYPEADVANDNEADALVLAAIGARLAGQPIEDSLPAANLRAMDKVRWAS